MNPIVSTGVLIGVACAAWTFVMGFSGWYKDPALARVFFLVVPIEIAGLVLGLRRTAREGRGYGGQLAAGTMMALVAGMIIVGSSLLFTSVVFPNSRVEIEQATRAALAGRPEPQIAGALRSNPGAAPPLAQAMSGFLGTVATGIAASAVIGAFVRSRRGRVRPPLS